MSTHTAIEIMLERYQIQEGADAENALKEIIQEIALLGLYRSKFFEKAAFYGGSALRILYSLPRFSEDLDFTLLKPNPNFSLSNYFSAIEKELQSYGFEVQIEPVIKKHSSDIDSAFIKANTQTQLLKIAPLAYLSQKLQHNARLKIKFEVDVDPVTSFETEPRYLLAPTSFSVVSLKKPDLFAGKLHALLYRNWRHRVKGRDYYDYVWYLKTKTPVRLSYFREKAIQTGHAQKTDFQTVQELKNCLCEHFKTISFEKAKEDISPFLKDQSELSLWSADFFEQITQDLEVLP